MNKTEQITFIHFLSGCIYATLMHVQKDLQLSNLLVEEHTSHTTAALVWLWGAKLTLDILDGAHLADEP